MKPMPGRQHHGSFTCSRCPGRRFRENLVEHIASPHRDLVLELNRWSGNSRSSSCGQSGRAARLTTFDVGSSSLPSTRPGSCLTSITFASQFRMRSGSPSGRSARRGRARRQAVDGNSIRSVAVGVTSQPRQLRFGSAGTIVTSACSSTETTYRFAAPRPRTRLRNDLRWSRSTTIAWVSVCVSISKPSRSFVSRNASRASFLPPVGSIAPAMASSLGEVYRPCESTSVCLGSTPRAPGGALAGFGLSAGDSGCRASRRSLLVCVTRRPAGVPPTELGSGTRRRVRNRTGQTPQ
jgi:hypothetical protein